VAIDYTQASSFKLKYRLTGIDKEWINIGNPAVARYADIRDGKYDFEIRVFDQNNNNLAQKNLKIEILAPFYRTTWFRILLAIILVSLAYFFYKLRSTQIRKDAQKIEQIRRIKAESEINALRSQMNPHFIFNCLNTVDSYILLNKTDEASKFLNKFSKLVRMILENSQQEFIPLQQDLETLELYIKLEQERSYPKFEYEFEIDKTCSENTFYIPSTIIQPFVENAILHGIRHKMEGVPKLNIEIEKLLDAIRITVKDNGIGRKAAEIINRDKNQNKTSLGLALTRERIARLHELYPNNASLEICDIDKKGETGTTVQLILPILTLENLNT
jgi:LytS/YehU family sensor histidine kinase